MFGGEDSFPNGKPQLLDHNGKPFQGRPDGSAHIGGIALPHAWTFIARQGGAFNTYWHERHDEALRHAREDAEVMRRDAYLMALLQERQLAVSGLNWHLDIPDGKDRYQQRVRDGLTRIIKGVPFLRRIISWMLDAIWYGRYGVQVEWAWGTFTDREAAATGKKPESNPLAAMGGGMPGMPGMPGGEEEDEDDTPGEKRRCLTVRRVWPVNGDKIGFQHDHTPYVLVAGDKADELPKADVISTTQGRALTLRGSWREKFILHRHLMEDVDYFNADQAGAVHGVGIRSKLFWLNWLKLEWLGNITDFFDRIGLGVTLWKYPAGNAAAKTEAESAARNQSGRAHVLVPVWGEAGREALTGVERIEVPTAGADALVKLIDYIDRQLERYVVGQEGSSKGSASGLGNEASSEFMQSTKANITLNDAHLLAVSLSGLSGEPSLVNTIQKYTYPEADFPVSWVFDVEQTKSDQKLASAKTLVEMGLKVKADEVRSAAGFSKPAAGDELVEPPPPAPGMPGSGGMPAPGAPPEGAGAPPGMPGAAPPGGDPSAPAGGGEGGAEGGEEEAKEGDFLSALQMRRDGESLRYDWQNKGFVKMSPTGVPIYRWYDPSKRQARIQNVRPGQGHKAGPGAAAARKDLGKGGAPKGSLDVGQSTRSLVEKILELMFPGGWVKANGLAALAGCEVGAAVTAWPRREADGTLSLLLRDDDNPAGEHALSLTPKGKLSFASGGELSDRAVHALEIAGVDEVDGQKPDSTDLPSEVEGGNRARREYRTDHADELMDRADELLPRPAEAKREREPEQNARTPLADVLRRLRDAGKKDMAREVALAYARRRGQR